MIQNVGIDTETQDDRIWCVGMATDTGRTAYQDWDAATRAVLQAPNLMPVFQNAKFDLAHIEGETGIRVADWHDTILEAHMLGYKPLNLPSMSAVFNGVPLDKTFVKERKKVRFEDRPDEVLAGCSLDAWAALSLHEQFYPQVEAGGWTDILEKEKKVTRVLMDMQRTGMPLSQEKLRKARITVLKLMGQMENILMAYGIDEPGNREFVGQKFWRRKKRVITTKKGKLSTKGADLREHMSEDEKPWVEAFIEWHQMAKFLSTYIENWMGQDWLHPSLNQTGTATWRFSCSDPNLQNVTKSKIVPLFQLFVAPEGYVFISFDYSQVELRVLAVESNDPVMLGIYRAGGDLHSETVAALEAMKVFAKLPPDKAGSDDAKRRFAKTLNFGIPYGMGGRTYAGRVGLKRMVTRDRYNRPVVPHEEPDEDAGNRFIAAWYNRFKKVRPWQEEQIAHAERYGYVETFDGRPLWVPGIYAERGQIRHHAEKQCGNYPIQGGAAEIVKDAMLRCPEYLVMQVHDELLYLVPEKEAQEYYNYLAEALVDNRHPIPYTVEGSMGKTWGDIKHLEDIWVEDEEEDEEE